MNLELSPFACVFSNYPTHFLVKKVGVTGLFKAVCTLSYVKLEPNLGDECPLTAF